MPMRTTTCIPLPNMLPLDLATRSQKSSVGLPEGKLEPKRKSNLIENHSLTSFSEWEAAIKASISSLVLGSVLPLRLLPFVPGIPLTLPYRELRVPLAQLFKVPSWLVGEASPSLSLSIDPMAIFSVPKLAGTSCLSCVRAAHFKNFKNSWATLFENWFQLTWLGPSRWSNHTKISLMHKC